MMIAPSVVPTSSSCSGTGARFPGACPLRPHKAATGRRGFFSVTRPPVVHCSRPVARASCSKSQPTCKSCVCKQLTCRWSASVRPDIAILVRSTHRVLNVREQLMKQRPAAVRPKQRAFVASASPYPATGGIQAFSREEPGGLLDRPPFHLVSLAPGPPSGSESRLRPSTGGRLGKLDPRPFRRDSLPRLPTSRARETR